MSDVRLVATNPDDNTLVPVAANASGQLAVQSPRIETVPNDLDVDGDLTVSGSGTFAEDVTINTVTVGLGGGSAAYNTALGQSALYSNIGGQYNTALGASALRSNTEGINNTAVGLSALYDNIGGQYNTALGVSALRSNTEGINNTAVGWSSGYYIRGDNNTILGAYVGTTADDDLNDTVIISAGSTERLRIDSGGVATFQGDVVVSSRGKKWMLVESGGLCHMVQQGSYTTLDLVAATEYPKLRDVFSELNVIEKALEEVMEKLRMTEPDGWPVWDGSDNS